MRYAAQSAEAREAQARLRAAEEEAAQAEEEVSLDALTRID